MTNDTPADTLEPQPVNSTEREVMSHLLESFVNLQKDTLRQRRREFMWGFMKFVMIAAFVCLMLFSTMMTTQPKFAEMINKGHSDFVAVVQLKGQIDASAPSSAVNLIKGLERAFKDSQAKGIVLYADSPGGSATQSFLVYDRIRALKAEYPDKEIITVATDRLASGAYLIASATDRIYVNRSSITGSIGVIVAGFGFPDALSKLGIERRVTTAGEAKAQMDPYRELSERDAQKLQSIVDTIHVQFMEAVQLGRGDRLGEGSERLFNGDVWVGAEAIELGLIDGLSDIYTVTEEQFGTKKLRDFTSTPNWSDQLLRRVAQTATGAVLDGFNETNTMSVQLR